MHDTMLDHWAAKLEERVLLEDFLDWLGGAGHAPPEFHSGRQAALDDYFGIDRRQLEKERRELLARCSPQLPTPPAAQSEPPTPLSHPSR